MAYVIGCHKMPFYGILLEFYWICILTLTLSVFFLLNLTKQYKFCVNMQLFLEHKGNCERKPSHWEPMEAEKNHHYSWKDLETKLFSVKKISVQPILTGKALLLLFLRNSKTNHVNKDIMNKIFLGNFPIRKNCIR